MRAIQKLFGAAVLALALLAAPALAATEAPSPAAFQAAQAAGTPILIHVTAPWCPTCAKQKPILAKLEADPKFADLQVFNIDFDTSKDLLRQFGVEMQSTLIAFHGKDERARSTGVTDPAKIAELLDQTKS